MALFSELEFLKKQFMEDFGIAAENFNPIKVGESFAWKPDGSDTYNKIIDLGAGGVPFFRDYELVESVIRKAYVAQFPDDAEMAALDANLPNLKLSAEQQEEIAKHRYEERLQEKYAKLLNEEGKEALPDDVQYQLAVIEKAKEQVGLGPAQPGQITVSDRANTQEIDNELLNRIKLHLNERHEKDIKISESFAGLDSAEAPYDMKAFE